jgi:glycogen operon protein
LADADWFDTGLRTIGMYLDGRALRHRSTRGETIVDDSFLLLLHSGDHDCDFRLPGPPWARRYEQVVDTGGVGGRPPAKRIVKAGGPLPMQSRSVVLLRVRRS